MVRFVLAIAATAATHPCALGDEYSEGERLFALSVRPIFQEKCAACHGADESDLQGGFDLRTRESMAAGGESFGHDVLKPGDGNGSILYRVVARTEEWFEMPPKEAEALTEEQAWAIRDWINAGAPWPEEDRVAAIVAEYAEGVTVATSGGQSASWTERRYDPEDLWGWRPLEVAEVPADVHPIDHFLDARFEQISLWPAQRADGRTVGRRLAFGLTGLPPEPGRVDRFAAHYEADSPGAVAEYADELMASHHYGEHFGRQWLDVARYADTAGFANDFARPNAWRYRDYVIRSFNEDKRFDEFALEQLAGDEIAPDDPEARIATGFLRMGPWEHTAMSVFRETRQQWLDDVVDSVGQAFLGQPLQCAKCHDHKFDPIPTRDYYAMYAVFSTTQFAEIDTPFVEEERQAGFAESERLTRAKIAAFERDRKALEDRVAAGREADTGIIKTGENGLSGGDEASFTRMNKNIERHRWELDRTRPIAFSVFTGKTIPRKGVSTRVRRPADPWAEGYVPEDAILNGGDVAAAGDPVVPAALSAAETLGGMSEVAFPEGRGARRQALAEWVTSPDNPLTARVIVNRVWAWHFGRGLAGNPNNFGATGKKPTHPRLLDYLADRFMRDGWSIKSLNRLIVSSEAYRRSSSHPEPERAAELDPLGESYATFTPRRLTAEELRDAMLVASGELNRAVGGIPARPDINLEVAFQPRRVMGSTASVYEPDPLPEGRNRRSVYAERVRGVRDPFLETFNQPGFDKSCELRGTSIVAPQALTLMNATEVYDRALAFAHRVLEATPSESRAVGTMFRLAFGRRPNDRERTACLDRWRAATAEESTRERSTFIPGETLTRTTIAEKTGEPYSFVETLPSYAEYVPDLRAEDVDARTRGLAHVALVIFNSNEFAHVD